MFFTVLPESGIEVFWPGIVLTGLFIGLLTGFFGVGGGFLLTPVLRNIFKIPYEVAVGSDLTLIFCNSVLCAFRHWRRKSADLRLGIILVAGAIAGAEIGGRFLSYLESQRSLSLFRSDIAVIDFVINMCFLVLISGVAVYVYKDTSSTKQENVETEISKRLKKIRIEPVIEFNSAGIGSMSIWVPLSVSFVTGILTGLLGVGGGFIMFPVLVYLLGANTLTAVGTSAFQILFASAYGAMRNGNAEVMLVLILFCGSFIGVNIGVWLSHLLKGYRIRRYYFYVLLGGVAVVLFGFFRVLSRG